MSGDSKCFVAVQMDGIGSSVRDMQTVTPSVQVQYRETATTIGVR
jgi:hypothetical protein